MDILTVLQPLIVAALVWLVMAGLKWASGQVDSTTDTKKRVLLTVVSAVAVVVGQLTHMELPTDLLHMDSTVVTTLVNVVVTALLAHFGHKTANVAKTLVSGGGQ
jgi:hypothetical protein